MTFFIRAAWATVNSPHLASWSILRFHRVNHVATIYGLLRTEHGIQKSALLVSEGTLSAVDTIEAGSLHPFTVVGIPSAVSEMFVEHSDSFLQCHGFIFQVAAIGFRFAEVRYLV